MVDWIKSTWVYHTSWTFFLSIYYFFIFIDLFYFFRICRPPNIHYFTYFKTRLERAYNSFGSYITGSIKYFIISRDLFSNIRNCYIPVHTQVGSPGLIVNTLISIQSEWLLFNANSAIFQLYHGENKLSVNEMMMTSALYTLNWIFVKLAHWNNNPQVDMSVHSNTLSWFRANQYLFFLTKNSVVVLTRSWHEPNDLSHSRRVR